MDKVNETKKSKYNISISNDILRDLIIDLLFYEERIRLENSQIPFDCDSIPMKGLVVMIYPDLCSLIYDLYITSPILSYPIAEGSKTRKNTRYKLLKSRHQRHGKWT